jgi:WD40 repeat protein
VSDGKRGYLLATRNTQNSLIAVPFDAVTLRTVGEPITVWSGNPLSTFQLSPAGTLALATQSADMSDRRLAWIDLKGQPQPIPGMTRNFGEIVVSLDGGRVLAQLENPISSEITADLGVLDLARRTCTRIPVPGGLIGMTWSRDGQRIAYGLIKDDAFSIWERRSDGSGEPIKLCSSPDNRTLLVPNCWSPDGKVLCFIQVDVSANKAHRFLLEQESGSNKWVARPQVKSPASEWVAGFSPDGKWLLLTSDQSGRAELYVEKFTPSADAEVKAERVQLSTSGAGGLAWWSADGKEIRYLDADSQVISLQVNSEPTFSATEPKVLYSIKDLKTRSTSFAPDGRLMVVLQGESEKTTKKVDLVVNFLEELQNRFATKK